MNKEELKFNLMILNQFIYFDDNNYLREKCSNDDLLRDIIHKFEVAKDSLLTKEPDIKADKLFLYSNIGNLYRILGNSQLAIECLEKAIELSEENKLIINLIRLGEALKYSGQHGQSLIKFDEAIELCSYVSNTGLLDFAFQHKGKCLLELGQIDAAFDYFQKAMQIRLVKGEQSLIESTQLAIEFTKLHRAM